MFAKVSSLGLFGLNAFPVDVEINLSGAANIVGSIECRKLKLKMSGAGEGKLELRGAVPRGLHRGQGL